MKDVQTMSESNEGRSVAEVTGKKSWMVQSDCMKSSLIDDSSVQVQRDGGGAKPRLQNVIVKCGRPIRQHYWDG